MLGRRNPDFYMDRAPTEPVEFNTDDFLPAMDAVYEAKRVRMLVPAQAWHLVRRLREAPRREKWFARVDPRRLELAPDPKALPGEHWRYVDVGSGLRVVFEEDGNAFREVPYPPGAFTVGELALLEQLLWEASYRAAEAAEAGTLARDDRLAAVELVEAADELSMRLAVLKIQPTTAAEAQALKASALAVLAREPEDNPKGYGPVRASRAEVTWVRPSNEARKTARSYLRRVEKLPPSRRGALTKKEAKKQGITSGVERAESIARGDLQPAEDLRDFFNRFKGTYRKALESDKAWERSKVQQAWDAWGGTPMWKDAMKALGEPPPELFPNPSSCTPSAAARFITEAIHRGWRAPVAGGLADGRSPAEFHLPDLAAGLCVETEHTADWSMAMRIAMDHLAEHPGYYPALARMEAALEAEGNPRGPRRAFAEGMVYRVVEPEIGTFDLRVFSDPHDDPMRSFQVGRVGGFVGRVGDDCREYVKAFEVEHPELNRRRYFQVYKTHLDDEYRDRGLGTRMYETLMAEVFDRLGPFMFASSHCSVAGSTSFDAQRVWASLARRYPHKGFGQKRLRSGATYLQPGVIAVLERPRLTPVENPYSEEAVPDKYVGGLKGKKAKKRRKEIAKRSKKESGDPEAYEPFDTDEGETTKKSRHTRRYHKLYGKGGSVAKVAKETGIPKRVLQEVYDRGLAAWRTGHRPGATQHQWALARVYSFATGGPTWRTADKDLAKKARDSGFKPKKNPSSGDFAREAELIVQATASAGIELEPPGPIGRPVEGYPVAFIGEGIEASVFATRWNGRPVVAKLYLDPTLTVETSAAVLHKQIQRGGPLRGLAEVLAVLGVPGHPELGVVIQERVTRIDDLDQPGAPPFAGLAAPYLAETLEDVADCLLDECPDHDDLGMALRADLVAGAALLGLDRDHLDTLDWSKENVGMAVRQGRPQAVILDFGL